MLEFLERALNAQTMTMILAAVAAGATVLTLAMPLVLDRPLDKRMKAVAIEREKMRQRERERLAQRSEKISLRQSPKQYMQAIVDHFNLSKWLGQEEARLKLVQAGYRGQAPYITYLFFRLVTPVVTVRGDAVLSVRRAQGQSAAADQDRHLHRRRLSRHAGAAAVPEEHDRSAASSRSSAPFPTRSTCC